jgi:uncharacterized protein YciI
MDFLIYSRGTPEAAHTDHDPGLDERHWSYMDGFANGMTARGPTLAPGRQAWTGSLHVVDLPDPQAARDFVAGEPYQQAGLFEEHFIWRYTNILGRTMWQFERAADEPCFLVLAAAAKDLPDGSPLAPIPVVDLAPPLRERLIMYGALRDLDDEDHGAGMALTVQAPTREALNALLDDRRAVLANCADIEIHDWEFGGRR